MTQLKTTARGGRQEFSRLFLSSISQKSLSSVNTVNGRMANSRCGVKRIGAILQIKPRGKKDKTIISTMLGALCIANLVERYCGNRYQVTRVKSLN